MALDHITPIELSDNFNTWRLRTNKIIESAANAVGESIITANVTITGSNTDIEGATFKVYANAAFYGTTEFPGTVINGLTIANGGLTISSGNVTFPSVEATSNVITSLVTARAPTSANTGTDIRLVATNGQGSGVRTSGGTVYITGGTGEDGAATAVAVGGDVNITAGRGIGGSGSYGGDINLRAGNTTPVIKLQVPSNGNISANVGIDVAYGDVNLATAGRSFQIQGTSVLNATTLGSGVTSSSLTSVGTLTGLTVSGTTNLGAIGNVTITGGSSGQVLQTNGSGTLSFVNQTADTLDEVTSQGSTTTNTITVGGFILTSSNVQIGGSATTGRQGVAIGFNTHAPQNSVSVGQYAGDLSTSEDSIAVGAFAGYTGGGQYTVAVGGSAGRNNQSIYSVALGHQAGESSLGQGSVAVGYQSTYTGTPGDYTVGLGYNAGRDGQGAYAVAIGYQAGYTQDQGTSSVAVGGSAGRTKQGQYSVAVGSNAGTTNQSNNSVAIGYSAGKTQQGKYHGASDELAGAEDAVAVGAYAGENYQGRGAVAVGYQAGEETQGIYAVAIGHDAGEFEQSNYSVALGFNAGTTSQGSSSVAIGAYAGQTSQGDQCVAIGRSALGNGTQSNYSVAVGGLAGNDGQGAYALALGYKAGYDGSNAQGAGGIILNASSNILGVNSTTAGHIIVKTDEAELSFDPSTNYWKMWDGGAAGPTELHVDGDITAFSSISFSDATMKENISPISNALEKVSALRGVHFEWNCGHRKGNSDVGVIAQDVESVLPDIVQEKESPFLEGRGKLKTVDYDKLSAVFIEAIKELKTEIDYLKTLISK